ncbi:hypothetical protein Cgig2_033072 [Carnegiea gigantea]|uniref:Uncharacterized protein n=1 Tax=Carnegiea gigantea TaxID=171969 RepID=A0A9Q1GJW5_9CARY|nr:hypothetical protein Cgig2_033072 [Carnegiea gigantea]
MGLFLGIFLGIAIGVALIFAFTSYEAIRAKRRSELAATVAALGRMTVQDARKILPPEFYPPWVVFSQMQKAASELIKSSVEPILEQYRPAMLASLKFSTLTLGTVAPQFTGQCDNWICIVDSEPGEIVMELEMKWDGNPNILLDIKTHVGVGLPIQVKDIGFTGLFRIIFKPLIDEFPCFGAISYSLRQKKELDFTLKVIGGDIGSIPGLSDTIDETIRDAIEDSITWPVRQIIPIIPGDYRKCDIPVITRATSSLGLPFKMPLCLPYSVRALGETSKLGLGWLCNLELKPCGMVEVRLVQAKELSNKELIGKSDPFASIFVRPLSNSTKRSKTINNELNPIWNENFEFVVEDPVTQHVTIRVFDDEGLQPPEPIGCAQVAIKDLDPGKVKVLRLNLVKDLVIQRDTKYRGQVHLELLYCPFGSEDQLTNPFQPALPLTSMEKLLKDDSGSNAGDTKRKASERRCEIFLRGVLSVTVVSAENLPVMDLSGKSDPYVVVILRKAGTKKKTRVLNETLNPVWNQTFDFVVEDALHELLMFEMYDHDTIGKNYMGRYVMTLTRILLEVEFYDVFPLDGAKCGTLALHLKWAAQPITRDPRLAK